MPNKTRGVGLFTAENIVAAIRAIPESDGTYRDVARKAEQYGGNFHHQTIANWVRHGQADMETGQPSTAYARFTKRYQDLIDEHCGPDNNRNREFDRALELDFAHFERCKRERLQLVSPRWSGVLGHRRLRPTVKNLRR